ncbi:MAG: hypothetical protein CVT83_05065 [Alphaproteobacteria bacterium HGW-Alphaproteobacteria-5]|nr:MAG: hypothetical protein CVT83_05065 [Alphaproteobacteria bacterium HGW-Alphaproteobacteria-5]
MIFLLNIFYGFSEYRQIYRHFSAVLKRLTLCSLNRDMHFDESIVAYVRENDTICPILGQITGSLSYPALETPLHKGRLRSLKNIHNLGCCRFHGHEVKVS